MTEDYLLIPLTQGQAAKVSPHRYGYLMRWKWISQWDRKMGKFYATARSRKSDGESFKYIRMSRVILELKRGDGLHAEHANGDTLDNRDENLRIATPTQNQWNRGATRRNTSGYKCVSWHKGHKKWAVNVRFDGRQVCLGDFDCPKVAHAAYTAFVEKHRPEFGRSA